MSSRLLKALTQQGEHCTGNISSWKIRVLPNGALVEDAEIDNYTIVELGFNAEGERICKQLRDVATKGYLIASPERMYVGGEQLADFYNEKGERVRVIFLDEGLRFETSAFAPNTGVTEVKNGMVAHFDPATKKYIISDATAPHADFATAKDKFAVVNFEEDIDYVIDEQPLVRLEVMA